jgi:hypothetical protein
MRMTRLQAIVLISSLQILLPALLILWTWKGSYRSVVEWALRVCVLVGYVAFIYLAGTWAFASFYLRYAVVLASLAAVVRSGFYLRGLPLWQAGGPLLWVRAAALSVALAALLVLVVGAIRARYFEERPVALSLPLGHGVYAVFEGGNGQRSPLMNYHFGSATHGRSGVNRSMRYAVDLTRLSPWGNDARGVFPRRTEAYPVFRQPVLSPCDGTVREVVDQWPNEVPWSGEGPYNLGNHILIQYGDVYVLVGHLQQGSITVAAGSHVRVGEPIAAVGNSGWTSQPHLHIQAMKMDPASFWKGEGLPILFDGRNPLKNALFFRQPASRTTARGRRGTVRRPRKA